MPQRENEEGQKIIVTNVNEDSRRSQQKTSILRKAIVMPEKHLGFDREIEEESHEQNWTSKQT